MSHICDAGLTNELLYHTYVTHDNERVKRVW